MSGHDTTLTKKEQERVVQLMIAFTFPSYPLAEVKGIPAEKNLQLA